MAGTAAPSKTWVGPGERPAPPVRRRGSVRVTAPRVRGDSPRNVPGLSTVWVDQAGWLGEIPRFRRRRPGSPGSWPGRAGRWHEAVGCAIVRVMRSTVAVIGAGVSGLAMGLRLQQAGIPFTIFEKG